jgi:hypothetical protein
MIRFSTSVGASCAVFSVLLMAGGPAAATHVRHAQCTLDTTKVESAMESTAELSALSKRVNDTFDRLQAHSHGLDERSHRAAFRADWLCEVERQCGRYASIETGLGRCLRDALRRRANGLESQARDLENQ